MAGEVQEQNNTISLRGVFERIYIPARKSISSHNIFSDEIDVKEWKL